MTEESQSKRLGSLSISELLEEALEANISLDRDASDAAYTRWCAAMDEMRKRLGAPLAVAQAPKRSSDECLTLDTPIGRLVATTRGTEPGVYDAISIDLEKPDGTSGQVATVEVVSGFEAEAYPTRLHTFVWNGDDEECERIDCNHEGEFMQDRGWVMGEKREARDDPAAPAREAVAAARSQGQRPDGPEKTCRRV